MTTSHYEYLRISLSTASTMESDSRVEQSDLQEAFSLHQLWRQRKSAGEILLVDCHQC